MTRISIEQMPEVKPENLRHLIRYVNFINSRPERDLKKDGKYFNIHHIIPRSLEGSDKQSNLIKLTHREHFIAHMILWCCGYLPMLYAFRQMVYTSGNINKINSKQYQRLKTEFSERTTGKDNPKFGKSLSIMRKKSISDESKDRAWFTNGDKTIFIKNLSEIPEGFVKGRKLVYKEKVIKPKKERIKKIKFIKEKGSHIRAVLSYNINTKIITVYESIKDASIIFGVHPTTIVSYCEYNRIINNEVFIYITQKEYSMKDIYTYFSDNKMNEVLESKKLLKKYKGAEKYYGHDKHRVFSEEHKQNISKARKGIKVSEQQKEAISKTLSGAHFWITNDIETLKVKTGTEIPVGWHKGHNYKQFRKRPLYGKDNPRARPIICNETGQIFDTVTIASEAFNTSRGSITYSAKNNCIIKCLQYSFSYYTP